MHPSEKLMTGGHDFKGLIRLGLWSWPEAAGLEQGSGDVVRQVAEPERGIVKVLEPHVVASVGPLKVPGRSR